MKIICWTYGTCFMLLCLIFTWVAGREDWRYGIPAAEALIGAAAVFAMLVRNTDDSVPPEFSGFCDPPPRCPAMICGRKLRTLSPRFMAYCAEGIILPAYHILLGVIFITAFIIEPESGFIRVVFCIFFPCLLLPWGKGAVWDMEEKCIRIERRKYLNNLETRKIDRDTAICFDEMARLVISGGKFPTLTIVAGSVSFSICKGNRVELMHEAVKLSGVMGGKELCLAK